MLMLAAYPSPTRGLDIRDSVGMDCSILGWAFGDASMKIFSEHRPTLLLYHNPVNHLRAR